ncbi:hypothetical protein BGX27_011344 [Mortierella sp. AM989]|nr:hypothetical protein BGX27_011344 [Mortierella sp. AM989]
MSSMDFINQSWGNPLSHSDGNGGFITDPPTPMELQGLAWSDMSYLCHVVTHTNFDKSTGNTIKFVHVNGTVSIYQSAKGLITHDGMPILIASDEPDIGYDITILYISTAMTFQLQINMTGYDRNPKQTKDILTHIYISSKDELVNFANPELMAMVFPELFPYASNTESASESDSLKSLYYSEKITDFQLGLQSEGKGLMPSLMTQHTKRYQTANLCDYKKPTSNFEEKPHFMLDLSDPQVAKLFSDDGWEEITAGVPSQEMYSQDVADYMDKFANIKSISALEKALKNRPSEPEHEIIYDCLYRTVSFNKSL